ncbi:hypothetical protein CTEN210_02519 [Chaetoceros tenuissimus]|uniref:Uncharacterized protein n=1 Tax=Chaetoceros tenuissimus TaxID=426638 RepID=A0AAD3CJ18_9STRA|nr:hypothetical protein CTEN210_02519 [Chaetoceros tenuissimus]
MASLNSITRGFANMAVRSRFTATSTTKAASTNIRSFSSGSDKTWNKWQENLINSDLDQDVTSVKKRGGKTLRKKQAAKEISLSDQNRLLDGAGPGQFPPLRFSDEETEKLLAEAYSLIPERAGKRGTRALKRQKNRFRSIRKAASIKKQEKINHHFDRMDKRSFKVESIRRMKEIAVDVRQQDQAYQMEVMKRYAALMNGQSNVQEVEAITNDKN